MSEKLYRIRRKSDGLFSTGGSRPLWTKNGKLWRAPALKLHIRMLEQYHRIDGWKWPYRECELVEYEMAVKTVGPVSEPSW